MTKISEKKILCESCQHYMRNSSCGACVDMGMKKTEQLINDMNLMNNSANSNEKSENFENNETLEKNNETIDINLGLTQLDRYKYACKVVANDPSDFEVVNPYDCKYYFSNAIKMF